MPESARECIDRIARELYALGATDEQVREFAHAVMALLFGNLLDGKLPPYEKGQAQEEDD